MLGRKLFKLELLMLINCYDFPIRNFLATIPPIVQLVELIIINFINQGGVGEARASSFMFLDILL